MLLILLAANLAKIGQDLEISEIKIKDTKTAFFKKILSSKNCNEIWKVVHRVLKPNDNTLKVDTNKLIKYLNDTPSKACLSEINEQKRIKKLNRFIS